jgi:hypothetical protein
MIVKNGLTKAFKIPKRTEMAMSVNMPSICTPLNIVPTIVNAIRLTIIFVRKDTFFIVNPVIRNRKLLNKIYV